MPFKKNAFLGTAFEPNRAGLARLRFGQLMGQNRNSDCRRKVGYGLPRVFWSDC
jgi:hypothetical protein